MKNSLLIWLLMTVSICRAENGYDLWLRYKPLTDILKKNEYRSQFSSIHIPGNSATLIVARKELQNGLTGLLDKKIPFGTSVRQSNIIVAGTKATIPDLVKWNIEKEFAILGQEGFAMLKRTIDGKKITAIIANTDTGVLYGVFHLLRLIQTLQPVPNYYVSVPKIKLRLLNHWDNLNRVVERGYAGFSLWNWHTLPDYIDQRYIDYARANASIGINGTVLTNVNANATVLTHPYLLKVAALANTFRPYSIKVYLTARFSAPIEVGGLKTADPLNDSVRQWWKDKVKEIYELIPDFGGFLVKANSEGQPGPQNYGRNHADGANMLAEALAPFNGIVMWRAFVYSSENPQDRHKQAYDEFVPLDGKFNKNVLVQVKNGAIDFQPREPFHPLFGAMKKTPLMMEFQVTQEYLGQGTSLAYLAPLFKECLESRTYRPEKNSIVSDNIEGMAGVSNIGTDINWCGHPLSAANWFALGRLSWDHELSAETIAGDWIKMSFSNDEILVKALSQMMMSSREAVVDYMTPLGLHHLMATGHHYGPGPWVDNLSRADWNPVYYHRADKNGIGFDRGAKGSNAVGQYANELSAQWNDPSTTPEELLLWFHHLPWDYKMRSGRTLWEEICYKYNEGVLSVRKLIKTWDSLKPRVDDERFRQIKMLLAIQEKEAVWWRDACLSYFQPFSGREIPSEIEKPAHSLTYYKNLQFPFAPGN